MKVEINMYTKLHTKAGLVIKKGFEACISFIIFKSSWGGTQDFLLESKGGKFLLFLLKKLRYTSWIISRIDSITIFLVVVDTILLKISFTE